MLDAAAATAFENVEKPDNVAVDVGARIRERVSNPRLGGQMYDTLEPLGREQTGDGRGISEVGLYESKPRIAGEQP